MNDLNGISHSNHCRACKERVRELLVAIHGDCQVNHAFDWPALPDAYEHTPIGPALRRIHAEMGNLRGYRDFVKSPTVPPCDYFIADPPFILEFDESQHFSGPRRVSLSCYPADLAMGFSVPRWRNLCREINAKDGLPIDRDERRAWYDTLRDLVPLIHGFRPTVRLYGGATAWCALNAVDPKDIIRFRRLMEPT